MARRKKPFLRRVGDALAKFWEELTEEDSPTGSDDDPASIERARRPLPPRPFGVPAPPPRVPRPAPPTAEESVRDQTDLWDHGEYPEHWSPIQRELWDAEPMTLRRFYNDEEWRQLQEAFDYGWFHHREGMTKEQHDEWRQRFYEITGITEASFDWRAYRDYVNAEFGY